MRVQSLPILFATLLFSGCSQKPVERVTDAVVTLPAVPGNPGAAYFTLHGGPAENRLLEISSPQVIRIELHDVVMQGGMMKMTQLATGVAIPAGDSVSFAPGGKHAMLFDINPAIKKGDDVPLAFTYATGRKIIVTAKAMGPGGASKHGDGNSH